jgi:hypothetical protein
MCKRGLVVQQKGTTCEQETATSGLYNWGLFMGCNPIFWAYSVGIEDWDNNKQICRYTWNYAPFTIHNIVTIILITSLTVFLVCLGLKAEASKGGNNGNSANKKREKSGSKGKDKAGKKNIGQDLQSSQDYMQQSSLNQNTIPSLETSGMLQASPGDLSTPLVENQGSVNN